jgi:proline dehydrogenase
MINKLIANLLPHMPKKLIWVFSKRYIAGETIDEGILAAKLLNEKKIEVTIDLLGEFITTLDEARQNRDQYLEIINCFVNEKVIGNFSLKPTMFGLLIDKDVCYRYIREIVALAALKNTFIRIDMEDSGCVDLEIELYNKLRAEYPRNVGLVLQAYLRRTMDDIKRFHVIDAGANQLSFRLCKGIYVEPERIAFKGYHEIRDHFLEDLEFMLKNHIYVGIATHDKYLVEKAFVLIDKYKVPAHRYEFQMLYGVTPELRQFIVDKGHKMRVYVPFGKQWFKYSTRRLKENPKVATDIIKALFIRG